MPDPLVPENDVHGTGIQKHDRSERDVPGAHGGPDQDAEPMDVAGEFPDWSPSPPNLVVERKWNSE